MASPCPAGCGFLYPFRLVGDEAPCYRNPFDRLTTTEAAGCLTAAGLEEFRKVSGIVEAESLGDFVIP